MGSWGFEHSAESKAAPEKVWERYTDVEQWPEWTKGVEEASLEGEFEAGNHGMSKAPHLPKTRFELVDVEPGRRFVSQTKVPGGTIRFEHELEPAGEGTRITHRGTISGALEALWTPLLGRIVKRELPAGVERLAELAAEKQQQEREEAEEAEERRERLKKADEEFKEEIEKTSSGEGDAGGASLPGSV
jgi:hypothetical protein